MVEEIICTKLITASYASAFLTSSTIKYFSENPFYSYSRVALFQRLFFKKILALTKDVPENIQR